MDAEEIRRIYREMGFPTRFEDFDETRRRQYDFPNVGDTVVTRVTYGPAGVRIDGQFVDYDQIPENLFVEEECEAEMLGSMIVMPDGVIERWLKERRTIDWVVKEHNLPEEYVRYRLFIYYLTHAYELDGLDDNPPKV